MAYLKELMLISCLLALSTGEDNVTLTASDNQINPLTTKNFVLTCMYEGGNSQVLSLQLFKIINNKVKGGRFQELVSMTADSKINILSPLGNVKYSGKVYGKDKAFLSGEWSRVPKDIDGLYNCQVNLLDRVGNPKRLYREIVIAEQEMSFTLALAAIQELQSSVQKHYKEQQISEEKCEQRYHETKSLLATSQGELKSQQEYSRTLSQKLSTVSAWKEWATSMLQLVERAAFQVAYSGMYGNTYYIIYNFSAVKYVRDAEIICKLRGGYMAEVGDYNEWKFIASWLADVNRKEYIYISGRRTSFGHDHFYWQRHGESSQAYERWGHDQTNGKDHQDCLAMDEKYDWKMNDVHCNDLDDDKSAFICEIPQAKKYID